MAHGSTMDQGKWPSKDAEYAGYYEQAQQLKAAGVDMLFIEMVWHWTRHGRMAVKAACSVGLPVAISLAVFDADSCHAGRPHLGDGTLVEEVAKEISEASWQNVVAMCIHHTKLPMILPCLRALRRGGWDGVLGCYPDHGTFKMPHWCYDPLASEHFLGLAAQWVAEAKCGMLGGCCGIGPETITELSAWCRRQDGNVCDNGMQEQQAHQGNELPILIIGAGVSGLAAAAECMKRDHDVVILEKQEQIGGVWKSFGNTSSKLQSHSSSYQVELDNPHDMSAYPSKGEVMKYLEGWTESKKIDK
jgi:hypothetical protein